MLEKITAKEIREFLVYLQEDEPDGRWDIDAWNTKKPLAARTIRHFANTLKIFLGWVTREAELKRNPFTNINMPKVNDQ